MKIKSFIAVLLSSLLMVSIGHNIIPHHHHLDDILSHTACHHHEAELQTGELNDHFGAKENPCQHCHAFNGLNYLISFDKDTWSNSVKTIADNCLEVSSRIDDQLPGEYFIYLSREPIPYFSGFFIETSGLRAPPRSA
jgi:hypothetical protein